MKATPQTNTTLQEIADVLKGKDDIVIAGHVSPDGDCIGSQLALMWALRSLGKTVTCTLATSRGAARYLDRLPGFDELVFAGKFKGKVDTFVAVDVPTHDRLDEAQWKLHEKASTTITIDHHAVDSRMADYSFTVPGSASTTMLIWRLVKCMGVEPDSTIATCAFAGLMTDTNSWSNQNSDADSFRVAAEMVEAGANPGQIAADVLQRRNLAALSLESLAIDRMRFAADGAFVITYIMRDDMTRFNARPDDTESVVSTLRSIRGVRVACFLKEICLEGKTFFKGSFRAKDDTDVAAVARRHDGGGHTAAAGFRMYCSAEQAISQLCDEFEAILGA